MLASLERITALAVGAEPPSKSTHHRSVGSRIGRNDWVTGTAVRRRLELLGLAASQHRTQFLRSPTWMLAAQPYDRLGLGLSDGPRHHMGGARAFRQPGWTLGPTWWPEISSRPPLMA